MPHTPHKIPVSGGNSRFSLGQYPHVTSQAGPAAGCTEYRSGLDEGLSITFAYGLFVYGLRSGYYYKPGIRIHFSVLKYRRGLFQVAYPAVSTRAYNSLVNFYVLELTYRFSVRR